MRLESIDEQELERRANLVLEQFGGIIPYCREIYGRSLYHSASRAAHAFERFDRALAAEDDSEAVSSVHEALGHCGNLSRYFWPSKQNKKRSSVYALLAEARGRNLREAYGVTEDSPLKDRSLRDSLEHFDERLDKYFLALDAGMILPDPIVGPHEMAKDPRGHVFKLVDPEREIFVVLGTEFRYGALRTEIERLSNRSEPRI